MAPNMSFLHALLTLTLTSLLFAFGTRRLEATHGAAHSTPSEQSSVYVFGRLSRLGDASSFTADPRWSRIVVGEGTQREVHLVVVPSDAAPNSLHSTATIESAQREGSAYVIETGRTVHTARAFAFAPSCATEPHGVC